MKSGIAEDLDPSIKTGVGNPLSPYNNELLSAEDEKRIDDKGNLITQGQLWSEAGTGIYLSVLIHNRAKVHAATPMVAQVDLDITNAVVSTNPGRHWSMSLMTGVGKPRFMHDTFGASLELPMDLAEDATKRQYVTEWITNTALEAVSGCDLYMRKDSAKQLGLGVADAAQIVISKVL